MSERLTITNSVPAETTSSPGALLRRRLLLAVPVVGFAGLLLPLAWGLNHDPGKLPSALVGKAGPKFDLPPVKGRALGLSSDNLYGEVSLVNVFASWCLACREEHPLFMRLSRDKTVSIHGINYKDPPDAAAHWLDTMGDPYTRTGADREGRVAIDWGVYGVPETFVVGADGVITYRHIGAITDQTLAETILPLIQHLRSGSKEEGA